MSDIDSSLIRNHPLPAEFPGAHAIDEEEVEAVVRVCRSRSLFRYAGTQPQGEVNAFEEEFGRFIGVKHVLGVTSGTAALHAALFALGIGPGMEVMVPAYLWVSVVSAVVNLGAIPVLVDVDQTFCLDAADVERRITLRTAAIIIVHMNGAAADLDSLIEVARRHRLLVIEDCAQCVGGSFHGSRVGTFGDIATFSFQANKNMTCGEGGAVATNDLNLYQRAMAYHDNGYLRSSQGELLTDAEVCTWGRAERLDELRAAILRVQLRKLPFTIGRMQQSKRRIMEAIAGLGEIDFRRVPDPAGDTGCFLLTVFPDAETAHRVNAALREMGICGVSRDSSNVLLSRYGLHIYYNIPALVRKVGVYRTGAPWTLPENAGSTVEYGEGACPVADGLFSRSQLLAIPSCLTAMDEADIIRGFELAVGCARAG